MGIFGNYIGLFRESPGEVFCENDTICVDNAQLRFCSFTKLLPYHYIFTEKYDIMLLYEYFIVPHGGL